MVQVVKVEGEVRVKDGSGMSSQYYEREFELGDEISEVSVARSIIRKALIVEDLRKTVSGFKSVRTMQVVSMSKRGGKKEGSTKLEQLVSEATKLSAMPDNLDQYDTVRAKEEAIERSVAKKKQVDKSVKNNKSTGVAGSTVEDLGYID